MSDEDRAWHRRASFAGVTIDWPAIVRDAATGARRLSDIDAGAHVPPDVRHRLDRDAPAVWRLPSGRSAKLTYDDAGRVVLRAKLQDFFGVVETPRVGPRRVPVTVELLAPNGRPVQVTSDLASFWSRVYPEIRPALRARYPKHRW
jgi:ATP-dependent helicase HrpB